MIVSPIVLDNVGFGWLGRDRQTPQAATGRGERLVPGLERGQETISDPTLIILGGTRGGAEKYFPERLLVRPSIP